MYDRADFDQAAINRAIEFATKAHGQQVRKYTGEPYVNHCIEVATIVSQSKTATTAMIQAAILHDTVEDTPVTHSQLVYTFGQTVATLVWYLTDSTEGNRAARHAASVARLRVMASDQAKTIKAADIISNTRSIVEHDMSFAVVYLREIRQKLDVIYDGCDPFIFETANQGWIDGVNKLEQLRKNQ